MGVIRGLTRPLGRTRSLPGFSRYQAKDYPKPSNQLFESMIRWEIISLSSPRQEDQETSIHLHVHVNGGGTIFRPHLKVVVKYSNTHREMCALESRPQVSYLTSFKIFAISEFRVVCP